MSHKSSLLSSPSSIISHNRSKGTYAENLVCDFLRTKFYHILARNWRARMGELDVIAFSPEKILVFIEVKSIFAINGVDPTLQFHSYKQKQISKLASLYIAQHKLAPLSCRFDLITVRFTTKQLPFIEHFENVVDKNIWTPN